MGKIRLPKCKFRLSIFIAYNLFFVLYIIGKISNIYYLLGMGFFCFLNFLSIVQTGKLSLKNSFHELKLGIVYVLVFFVISFIIQLSNNNMQLSILLGDLGRFTIPIIYAYLFVNSIDKNEQKIFFDILLFRFILQFILININNFSVNYFLSLSWLSTDSLLESSLAHDFFILELFFLMINNKKNAFICMIFCMLSMKRLSFILAPLVFVFSNKIPSNIPVKKKYIILLKVMAIVSPIVLINLYSIEFRNFLYNTFNFDLNLFMSGRISIYNLLVNNIPQYNGLGSINNFLGPFAKKYYGTTWNGVLHNDFLRLYLETTIIGVIVFSNNIVEICKKNYWLFIMIAYLILVAITSHIFNYFSVWVTLYLSVMYYNSISEKSEVVK